MIRVSKLIDELKKFPADAFAYAYEGEVDAIVIISAQDKELGYIPAKYNDSANDGPAVIR